MRQYRAFACAAMSILVAGATVGSAATVSSTVSGLPALPVTVATLATQTPFAGFGFSATAFDTNLGQLTEIDITFSGTFAETVTTNASEFLSIKEEADLIVAGNFYVADANVQGAGATVGAGRTSALPNVSFDTTFIYNTPDQLATLAPVFAAAGGGPLNVSVAASTPAWGANVTSGELSFTALSVGLTYIYTPAAGGPGSGAAVPLPTAAMSGSALLGATMLRRRRA